MIGRPPVPAEVAETRFVYAVNETPASVTMFFWLQGSSSWSMAQFREVIDAIVFEWLDLTTSITTDQVQLERVRAILHGETELRYDKAIAPNHGVWSSSTFINCCIDIYWYAGDAGKRGHAITHLPSFPSEFTDNSMTMNSNGYVNVSEFAANFLARISTISTPTDPGVIPVVVHRVRDGVPLDHADLTTIVGAFPVPYVGTLRRRVRVSGRIASE